MRSEKRTRKDGSFYYSFIYWDGKRRIRLKQSEHPHFDNKEEANAWAKAKEAEFDCAKTRIQRRLKWKTQYYDFEKVSEDYIKFCKTQQPNSWKNTVIYLENYVLPFFLGVKASNNPNNWTMFYEDFRDWLRESAVTLKHPQRVIAFSTKNHCIKTLNTFLQFLMKKNKLDPSNFYKMKGFPSHLINQRESSDLISKEEYESVYRSLVDKCQDKATFFQCAYYTGMRFNEIMGLSVADLYAGKVEDKVLKSALDQHGMEHFGYIVLESQPKHKTLKRSNGGVVERKPLKGKKKICAKNHRIIPITNKDLYNNLVSLYKRQEDLLKRKKYGRDPKNYMLFEGSSTSGLVCGLRRAYEENKKTPKSYHCCRHTRCTELVGATRDFVMAKYWLGHARQETTMRYTHIYEQSARSAKQNLQKIDFIE